MLSTWYSESCTMLFHMWVFRKKVIGSMKKKTHREIYYRKGTLSSKIFLTPHILVWTECFLGLERKIWQILAVLKEIWITKGQPSSLSVPTFSNSSIFEGHLRYKQIKKGTLEK